jgi:hypothetical protein
MMGCEGCEVDLLTFSAAVGQTRRLKSRKLHDLVRKVAAGDFALPERMQQNCAFRCQESP